MTQIESSVTDFVKRHSALVVLTGLLVGWLSLYFVTKTEAESKYARKDDIAEIRTDIREIRNILTSGKH